MRRAAVHFLQALPHGTPTDLFFQRVNVCAAGSTHAYTTMHESQPFWVVSIESYLHFSIAQTCTPSSVKQIEFYFFLQFRKASRRYNITAAATRHCFCHNQGCRLHTEGCQRARTAAYTLPRTFSAAVRSSSGWEQGL